MIEGSGYGSGPADTDLGGLKTYGSGSATLVPVLFYGDSGFSGPDPKKRIQSNSGSATNQLNSPGFRIRIRIRIQWGHWIRIRIRNLNTDPDPDPGGQK